MPRYDELNALPYLDAVVRETLRLYAPVAATSRTSPEDCVIPLAEPIVDRKGVKRTEILYASTCSFFVSLKLFPSLTDMNVLQYRQEYWGRCSYCAHDDQHICVGS